MEVPKQDLIPGVLRSQADREALRITAHAHQEMVNEQISLDDVLNVLLDAAVVENYPNHQRGACCLVYGKSVDGRYIHVVCTTGHETAIVITVYRPKMPKWPTPFKRRK